MNFPSSILLTIIGATSTISYSWMVVALNISLMYILWMSKLSKVKFQLSRKKIFASIFVLSFLVSTTQHNDIADILKQAMLSLFLFVAIWVVNNETWEYFLKVIYYSCLLVVLYTFISGAFFEPEIYFSERRGYTAREYLFFGDKYDFTFGVTHLNIYISYIFCYFAYKEYKNKFGWSVFFLALLVSISTFSRSPYLILMEIIFLVAINKLNKQNFLLKIISLKVTIGIAALMLLFSIYYFDILYDSDRLYDVSRLIFWAKGFEHAYMSPFGNDLLISDPTMALLNYHNTFLALANRITAAHGIFLFMIGLYVFYKLFVRYLSEGDRSIYIALFSLHNFMIEDLFKFDFFAIFVFMGILFFSDKKLMTKKVV